MSEKLPTAYRKPPAEMSEATRRWCQERWPFFADNRRIRRACDEYERHQSEAVRKLRSVEV